MLPRTRKCNIVEYLKFALWKDKIAPGMNILIKDYFILQCISDNVMVICFVDI